MSDRAIIEAIYKMSGLYKVDQVAYVDAVVESVDSAKRTCVCSVLAGNAEYQVTAKLMAAVDDGLLIEPAIGSTVKLIFSVNVEPFVCQYSEIANITIDAATLIKLNDGSFGGLVKVDGVVNYLKKVFSDLTTISTALNGLGAPVILQTKTPNKKDFENEKIKHGV